MENQNQVQIDKVGRKYINIDLLPFQKIYPTLKFNHLTPISPVKIIDENIKNKEHGDIWWVFQCDCGNKICHHIASVRNGQITDCGCTKEKNDKYIGQTYNYLTIVEKDLNYKKEHNIKGKGSYYKCLCKCGNYKTVRLNMITSGGVKSCGCLKKEQEKINLVHGINLIDLTNKKFGNLTVLKRDLSIHDDGDSRWICKCDCGNIKSIRSSTLRNGGTTSCGCKRRSGGECAIAEILEKNNIEYLYDSDYFKDLILPSGGLGRYDFILLDENRKPYRLIEFDGFQHFYPVDYFGGEDEFKQRQNSDQIKNKYAKQHNLPLVRIPYNITPTYENIMGNEYIINELC